MQRFHHGVVEVSECKISVITVTYNASSYLEKTIQSILSQDYPNIEYLIIDGCSSDGTVDIIKRYEDAITYWVSEPDRGIYDAMNKGAEKATGEWINFMNAGDCFVSAETVTRFVDVVASETDIAYGDSWLVHPMSGEKQYLPVRGIEVLEIPAMPFTHQSVFIRSSVMKRHGYRTDYHFASDFDFFLMAYRQGYQFQYMVDCAIAEFLGGGIHEYNMPQYVAESINSMVEHSDDPRQFAQKRGVADACRWFYEQKKIKFSRSLGLLNLQMDRIKSQYKKIVVYGYGGVGQLATSKLAPIALIDRAVGTGIKDGFRFISPDTICREDFDALIITVLGRENEIIRALCANGVPEAKIVRLEI